ncbi:hypothetical protein B0T09DRAFT_348615, partial [Sordaria sp. MPI-SDFR-AT-0083]
MMERKLNEEPEICKVKKNCKMDNVRDFYSGLALKCDGNSELNLGTFITPLISLTFGLMLGKQGGHISTARMVCRLMSPWHCTVLFSFFFFVMLIHGLC